MIRIFRHYISTAYLWLLLVEGLVFYFAMYWGEAVRYFYTAFAYTQQEMTLPSLVFASVFVACCSLAGLYRKTLDREEYKLLERINLSFAMAIFVLVFLYYSIPELMLSRNVLVTAIIFSFFGQLVTRYVFYKFVNLDTLKRRVLVIGAGLRAEELQQVNSSFVHRGFEIVGYIAIEDEMLAVYEKLLVLGQPRNLMEIVTDEKVDEIVIAVDDRRKKLPVEELLDVKMSGIVVLDLQTFYEREQRLVFLETLGPSWLVFSDGFVNDGTRPLVKRSFDIVASILWLLATCWIMLLAALMICLESGFRAPVLYRQTRVGYRNRPFTVIKFRSMEVDAEEKGAQWTSEEDGRITRVGRFMRKYRIDELPQLFNVLRGDMSFVGPRPERPEFVEGFVQRIPYYKERHRVKPGITGWAQLCYPYGAGEKETRHKLQYDLYYVKNYSLFLDLTIMLSTMEVVLWGRGGR
jgi:sugar transferase (PEP-CTERM system associated)